MRKFNIKEHQLTILSRAIKNVSLGGCIFFNFSVTNLTHATVCLGNSVNGLNITSGECSSNLSFYSNTLTSSGSNYLISSKNPGTSLTLNASDILAEATLSDYSAVISARDGSTLKIDNKITAILNGTSNYSSVIASGNGSTLNLGTSTDITHNGGINGGAGLAAQTTSGGKPSYITANGLVTIRTTGAVGILATYGSVINLKGIDLTIGNNGNIRNNGLYALEQGSYISFDGGRINSVGAALRAENGAIITSRGNITATGSSQSINNNNATINFYGETNSFTGSAENKGTINLSNYPLIKVNSDDPSVLFGNLTIGGAFEGGSSQANSGVLIIDTKLDSDDLTKNNTDFITIGGGATGSTELKVINAGGSGARTYNKGIHIIQTQTSTPGAFFIGNKGHVTAGAYDYGLFLDSNNWYLRSHRNDGGVDPEIPVYTPDVGEYLATETMGNTLFTSRLEDREGASQYQNLGNSKDVGNVWVRAYGGHNQFKTMDSQLKTTGNSFVTQIGAGLVTLGEEDQYNLGAMTGFAYYDGKTRSNLTDRESKTKIDGYSLGLYGTWYAHPVEKRGAYIDSWVLWNKFNNKIDTPDQNQYKYDSSGITASIEVGGDYLINKNGQKNWWIQPQAQLIYQGVHADDFKDAQGVDVYHGKDNVQARMGVKTYLNIPTNGNKLTSYRPYVALNFIHNTNPYSIVIDDIRYENEGSANLGELKLGVEGQVTKNSQVWLNASYVAGSHSNQAYQGNIGWKYNF